MSEDKEHDHKILILLGLGACAAAGVVGIGFSRAVGVGDGSSSSTPPAASAPVLACVQQVESLNSKGRPVKIIAREQGGADVWRVALAPRDTAFVQLRCAYPTGDTLYVLAATGRHLQAMTLSISPIPAGVAAKPPAPGRAQALWSNVGTVHARYMASRGTVTIRPDPQGTVSGTFILELRDLARPKAPAALDLRGSYRSLVE